MMTTTRVRTFLDQQHVRYVVIGHSPAYTAQEIAESAHIPGREMAKTVILKIDGRMAMAVLPSSHQVDFDRLKKAVGAREVGLADEEEFEQLFPDCELGAMPPFGNLYGLAVYSAERLADDEEIAFNAGSHTELFLMRYKDYARLVQPQVIPFAAGAQAA